MSNDSDVLIIGGGLAGAAAGYHLARFGYRVAILERESKPHHKVCGEFLSPETIPYLAEMGIDLDLLKAAEINGFALQSRHFHQRLPLDTPARGISRYVLDEACLQSAINVGCHVLRGVHVENFDKPAPEGPFLLQTSHGEMKCRTLFLATGKHELKKILHRDGRENSALGFKMHLRLSPQARSELAQDVALFFFRGGYAGLCAVENDDINLCFIVDRKLYHDVGNTFEDVLSFLKNQNHGLDKMLKDSIPLWKHPLAIANLPYGYVFEPRDLSHVPVGLFPLGDQFAVIPSFTGSGMAIALYTARKAVEHFHQRGNQGVLPYTRECFRTIGPRMRLAYPVHAITQFPFLADTTIGFLKPVPKIARYLLAQTRMPAL
jgi:flavin-dependent dehydrogenase